MRKEVTRLGDVVENPYVGNVESSALKCARQNHLSVSRADSQLRGPHEEDVKVGQREPCEEQVKCVVRRLDHQRNLAQERMIAAPDLGYVNQRVYLHVSSF